MLFRAKLMRDNRPKKIGAIHLQTPVTPVRQMTIYTVQENGGQIGRKGQHANGNSHLDTSVKGRVVIKGQPRELPLACWPFRPICPRFLGPCIWSFVSQASLGLQVDGPYLLRPVSRINLARNNIQLPTPHLSPIFKHRLPIRPWISIFDPTIIIQTAFDT